MPSSIFSHRPLPTKRTHGILLDSAQQRCQQPSYKGTHKVGIASLLLANEPGASFTTLNAAFTWFLVLWRPGAETDVKMIIGQMALQQQNPVMARKGGDVTVGHRTLGQAPQVARYRYGL